MTRETSQTAWCVEKAIEFITAGEDAPWLFSVNMFDPHSAFDPPLEFLKPYLDRLDEIPLPDYEDGELEDKPLWQLYDHTKGAYGGDSPQFRPGAMTNRDHRLVRAAYWAMCDQIDYHVGRMLAALDESGQRENTLVIYTSDHGELLGDHGIYFKGPFFYDCSIKVPLIVSMPGTIKAQECSELVELLDLPQTILDAAGIEHHPGMMGRSLWPRLTGDVPDEHRSDVYCESLAACAGHNGETEQPAHATMVRTKTHKLVVAHGHDTGELYDLEKDPGEHRNLWNEPNAADLKSSLLLRLTNRIAFTVDPLPTRVAPW
jgi:arylsulfatase A-like enzyme